jgi:hypothetical protein
MTKNANAHEIVGTSRKHADEQNPFPLAGWNSCVSAQDDAAFIKTPASATVQGTEFFARGILR